MGKAGHWGHRDNCLVLPGVLFAVGGYCSASAGAMAFASGREGASCGGRLGSLQSPNKSKPQRTRSYAEQNTEASTAAHSSVAFLCVSQCPLWLKLFNTPC